MPSSTQALLITRLAALAETRGDWPALIGDRETLTFRALNSAVDRMAHGLRARLGTSPAIVALCLPRNVARLVAALAILKAGHAYVPIDPALHGAGRRDLVAHADAVAVLTDASLGASFGSNHAVIDIATLYASENSDGNSVGPAGDTAMYPGPEAMAYIRYTSGSTGAPKGVVHNHRAAYGQSMAYADATRIRPTDRLCCLSFFPHPIILGTLLSGAAFVAVDPVNLGLRGILDRLRRDQVSILSITPSALRALATALGAAPALPDLRCIALNGEPVTAADINRALRHVAPGGTAINNCGTSEFTQVASHHIGAPVPDGSAVPVGCPPAGVELRLLDADGAPVPDGTRGEIAVRAAFMSSGYWKRPDLTRAIFGSDTPQDGRADYRTGDIGRRDTDGLLYLLGRVDNQIKLRGHRVTPEEIEAVLRQHQAVADVAVGPFANEAGEMMLAAFIVAVPDATMDPTGLREHARAHLPPYMIPAVFIALDSLPLTVGGKLDRAALTPPGRR